MGSVIDNYNEFKYKNINDYTLEKDGIQIYQLFDDNEINNFRQIFWQDFQYKTNINYNDKSTWKKFFDLVPKHGMLLQHWDFGHNPLSWLLRTNNKIINVFANIHNTSELLTSFDGVSVSLAPEVTKRGWYRNNHDNLHCDQSFTRNNNFECAQGLVNLYDVDNNDATFRFIPGSHHFHSKYKGINNKLDWNKLDEDGIEFFKSNSQNNYDCVDICVKASAGSLLVWDGRLIHQGLQPQKDRQKANTRLVSYICMTPKQLATSAVLKRKQKIYNEKRTTNHYPHRPKMFSKEPRSYGLDIPKINLSDLSKYYINEEKMLSLSGF